MQEELLTVPQKAPPFNFVKYYDPVNLLDILKLELPQTIALILAHMELEKAAIILKNLPGDIEGDVLRRIATLNTVDSCFIQEIEQTLEKKLSSMGSSFNAPGGIDSAVGILLMVDGATEKKIINQLEDEDYELAGEIIKRLFLFEDLVMLDDRAIQKVLREIDALELAKALKGAGAEVQRKIFRNMSKRAAAMLREEIVYMGPIRVKDVNEAQEKIIAIVRHLEDMGEIIISRSAEDELVIGTIFSEDSKNSGNSDLTGGV